MQENNEVVFRLRNTAAEALSVNDVLRGMDLSGGRSSSSITQIIQARYEHTEAWGKDLVVERSQEYMQKGGIIALEVGDKRLKVDALRLVESSYMLAVIDFFVRVGIKDMAFFVSDSGKIVKVLG